MMMNGLLPIVVILTLLKLDAGSVLWIWAELYNTVFYQDCNNQETWPASDTQKSMGRIMLPMQLTRPV